MAVVSCGVMPGPKGMLGVRVPENRIAVAPPPVLPVEKLVAVPAPAVPAGKLMIAAGATCVGLVPLTVQPATERTTLAHDPEGRDRGEDQ